MNLQTSQTLLTGSFDLVREDSKTNLDSHTGDLTHFDNSIKLPIIKTDSRNDRIKISRESLKILD